MKRDVIIVIALLSIAGLWVYAFFGGYVKYNLMDSVERGWWVWSPGTPEIGDVVFFRDIPNAERWLADNPELRRLFAGGFGLLKPVVAVEGQQVCRVGSEVSIGGRIVGDAPVQSRVGGLPDWSGCKTLERGEYFVMSNRVDDSLDSRVFGPLPRGAVYGRYKHVYP